MHTFYLPSASTTAFILADLTPAQEAAARSLYYEPHPQGFAKSYPSDTPNLERIYGQFARHAEELLAQMAGERPVPWEVALSAYLQAIEGQGVNWWLVGSAALAVRGLPVAPHDLDLATDAEGAHRLAELLADELVEPLQDSRGWIADWFGRAFLGARVEWVGAVNAEADRPEPSDFGPLAYARRETVHWRGQAIQVPPLDLQLAVNRRRGLAERVRLIEAHLARG